MEPAPVLLEQINSLIIKLTFSEISKNTCRYFSFINNH